MRRFILNLLALSSLLLCGFMLAIWIRSYWVGGSVMWTNISFADGMTESQGEGFTGGTGHGGLLLTWLAIDDSSGSSKPPGRWHFEKIFEKIPDPSVTLHLHDLNFPATGSWERLGFAFGSSTVKFSPITMKGRVVIAPDWFMTVVLSSPGLLWIVVTLKRRKSSTQMEIRCEHCGYDLRATPHRCPECGAVPATKSTSI